MARTSPENGKKSSAALRGRARRVPTVREWVCLLLATAAVLAASVSARQQQSAPRVGAGTRQSGVGAKRQSPRVGAGAPKSEAVRSGAKGQSSIRSSLKADPLLNAALGGQPVLATADFDLIGLAVTAGPATQTVPRNTPTSVLTSMLVPEGSNPSEVAAGLNPNLRVRGELNGPSLNSPVTVEAAVGQPLRLPPLSAAGEHVLQNLRVVDVGAEGQPTVAPVTPDACGIVVIERLLVSEVQVRELTYEQIVQSGINISDDSYRFFNFTLGIGTTSSPQQISIPVAFPGVGVPDPRPVVGAPLPIAPGVSPPQIVPDVLPVMLEIQGGRDDLDIPPDVPLRIPGVVVFPGRIGLLHQFFEATVIVANGSPSGTPLVVRNLKARVRLPDAGTPAVDADDPLRIAETQAAGRVTELELHDLGPDGRYGTADDVNSFAPGKSGQGSFLVEGLKEGLHTINFDLEGTLDGLPAGPVTVRGEVPGAVLVRDASFAVTFSHPSVVRAGQEYDLALTLYNSGQRDIQSAVADLQRGAVSGAELLGDEVRRQFPPVARGESATVKWRLRANVTGAVTASYAKVGADISSGLQLVTGVGDRNIPLSPDSLTLPDTVNNLPPAVAEAARAVLGQAWSIATAPEGGLPEGVVKVDKRTVVNRAVQLGVAGLRAGFGEPASVSDATLMRDWMGELDSEPDAGFADVLRDTAAGFDFYDAVGAEAGRAMSEGRTPSEILGEFVAAESPRSPFVLGLVTQAQGQRVVGARLLDGAGRAVGFGGEPFARSGDLRSGASLRLLAAGPGGTGGEELGQFLFVSRPSDDTWSLELTGLSDGVVDVALALPVSGGKYRHLIVSGVQVAQGGRYRLRFRTSGTGAVALEEFRSGSYAQTGTVASTAATLSEPAPRVVGAVQVTPDVLAGGDKYGRLVGLLFSKPMTKATAETASNYTVAGGTLVGSGSSEQVGGALRALGAKLDYGDRFVFLSLDSPVGPFIGRTLGVSGLTDRRGAPLASAPGLPISMRVSPQGIPPGAYLTGRVLGADGTPVAGAQVVYWSQECDQEGLNPPGPKPLAQRLTDADGRYSFDYVRNGDCGPLLVTVTNPTTHSEKRLTTPVAYHGQHMTLDMVFLARGGVRGTVNMGGRPLANAIVQVIPSLDAMGSKTVQTDGFGQYAAGDIPVGNVSILAVGTGAASNASGVAAGTIEGPGRTTTVNVNLQNVSGVVRGRVVNPDTGASPASGALVVAYARIPGFPNPQRGDGMTPVGWVNASREGDFILENLPVGDVTLEVTDYVTGLVARRQLQLSAETPEVGGVVITLPGFGTISGQVVDETGGFVPGAVVQGAGRAVQADALGNYALPNMPAGTHRITATDPATFMSGSVDVEVRLGQTAGGINIPILRPATVTGRVFIQESGAASPSAAAGVFVTADGYRRVQTDADGRYTVKNVKPNAAVTLRFVDLGRNYVINMPVVVTPGETLTRNATFRPGAIRGRVTQPDGVTGAASPLSVYSPMPILREGEDWGKVTTDRPRSTQSGGDGVYRIDSLNPGTFRITTSSPFFPTPVSAGGVLPPGGEAEVNFSLVNTLAGKIQGVVYRPDGTTHAGSGVRVTLGGGSLADAAVLTDGEGRYEFAEVFAEGGYYLTATDPSTGETNRVRVSVQKNRDLIADLRLRGKGGLRVKVVDGAGNPVQDAQLSAGGGEYPNAQRYIDLTPAMGGVFEFGDLPEGPYAVSATRNGLAGRASADVPAGTSVEVTVQLQASGTVKGRAFMPDGTTPIGLADVELRLGGRQVGFSVTSDSDDDRGSFSFLNVPVGDFQLDVFDNRTGRVGRATGQLSAQGQVVEVDVKLLPVGAVTGRVTANGQGVDHALVEIYASGSGIRAERMKATTEPDGRYRFTGVPVGSFQVNVTSAPGGQTGSASGFVSGTAEPLADAVADIALEPSMTATGTVRSLSGAAVNGARVTILVGSRRYETGTNEQGAYRLSYVPLGEVRVRAEAPAGYDRGEAAPVAVTQPGATLVSDVTLAGTGSVSGIAYNNDGSPLSTGAVTYTNDAWQGSRVTMTVPVQSNGRYEIKGAPAGPFALKLTVANRVGVGSASGEIGAGVSLDLPIRLEDAGQVTGRLKSVDGTLPAVGADVTLSLRTGAGQLYRFYGHTDTQGVFLFRNVPLGTASADVNDPTTGGVARYAAAALVQNGQTLDLGSATLDNVAVAVESITPADGTTGVSPAEPGVTVRFSEAVDSSTVNPDTVSLVRGQSGVSTTVTLSADNRTAAIKPSGQLADLASYTVIVSTFVSDPAGNHLTKEARASFTTSDITPPRVESVSPQDGATGVVLDSNVTVSFSEPLDASLNPAELFALAPESSPTQALAGGATLDATRRVLTFDPAADFDENTVYVVKVAGLRDAAGNVQPQSFASTFRSFVTPGQGDVSVSVLGADNQPVFGAQLTLKNAGADLAAATGADGRHTFRRVPLGDVALFVSDPASGLRSKASGRLTRAGQNLQLDAKLFASGSVSGTVFRHDGTTPAAGLQVEVRPRFSGGAVGSTVTDAAGRYSVDYVPVGDFAIDALEASSGDRGSATVQVARNGEAREINVRLNGTGSVHVAVQDAGGRPVSGAEVSLSASFGQQLTQSTGADGSALFEQVLAGSFVALASDPATHLGGSQSGTLAAGSTAEVVVKLVPAGTIQGTVFAAGGSALAPGMSVRLVGESGAGEVAQAVTGEDGLFKFQHVPLDSYTLDVYDAAGHKRASAAGLKLTTNGQTITRDLALVATGSVTVRVLDPAGTPAAEVDVRLSSFNPEVGVQTDLKTDEQGLCRFEFVPVGRFTANATRNGTPRLEGETQGQVSQSGEEAAAEVRLVDNTFTLPGELRDGNDMPFDVQPDGTIATGKDELFNRASAAGSGGLLLDVVVGGTAHRFEGTRLASARQDGREFVINQAGVGGLDVTRKVFVPAHGYFARYLEVMTNSSSQPVTFDLKVQSNLFSINGSSYGPPQVLNTSSGDSSFGVSDRWVTLDDTRDSDAVDDNIPNMPSAAFVFDGAGAREHASAAGITGSGRARVLTYAWGGVTLQPGQTVAYLHFSVQEANRTAAKAAAERLAQLPPEALSGLSLEDISQVQNFDVPADGAGTVELLPRLDGKLTVRVLASDGVTPVGFKRVLFKSKHPLYPLTLTGGTDEAGYVAFASEVGFGSTRTVPTFGFSARAEGGRDAVVATTDGEFPAGQHEASVELVFTETGVVRGIVRRHNGEAVSGATVDLYGPGGPNDFVGRTQTGPDGGYYITLVPPGSYTLKPYVRGGNGAIQLTGPAVSCTVAARQATNADLTLEPSGSLTGVVRDAAGNPVAGASVTLGTTDNLTWDGTLTDASGRYLFEHVPAREMVVRAEQTGSAEAHVTIVQDQTTTQDLTLPAVGSLQVQVTHMNGGTAADSPVYLRAKGNTSSGWSHFGYTDSGGRLVINDVLAGAYDVKAYYPGENYVYGVASATVASHGEVVPVSVNLPGVGSISGRVLNPDGTPAPYAWLDIYDAGEYVDRFSADSGGNYSLPRVSAGKPLMIEAHDPTDGAFKQYDNVLIAADGGTLSLDLTLPARATVRVTVLRSTGEPYQGARVEIRDARSPNFGHTRNANSNGIASFEKVPEGAFAVRAFNPVSNALAGGVSGAVTAADHDGVVQVTITAAPSGVVRGTVFAGDGQTVIDGPVVWALNAATGVEVGRTTGDDTGHYLLDELPPGVNSVRVVTSSPIGKKTAEQVVTFNEARDPVTLDLVVPSAVIKGSVRYPDGSPVSSADMPLVITGSDGVEYQYHTSSRADGTYAQIVDDLGGFRMTVTDPTLGVSKEVTGVLDSVTVPVVLDVLMPPTGSVTGTLLDPSNNPVPNAWVAIMADPAFDEQYVYTDAQGKYSFARVPAGRFVLHASYPDYWAVSVVDGTLVEGQAMNLDVTLPEIGTVRGTVYRADGSPAPYADVFIRSLDDGGYYESTGHADELGNFEVPGIKFGRTRVAASLWGEGAGYVETVVTAGQTATADVTFGNAFLTWDNYNLDGADGFRYDVVGDYALSRGGTADGSLAGAYSYSYYLRLGLDYLWDYSVVPVEDGGREIVLGPMSHRRLSATRKVFVPVAGRFARTLDIITNPAPYDINVPVTLEVQLDYSSTHVVTSAAQGGGLYAVTDGGGEAKVSLGHVFGGAGARVTPVVEGLAEGRNFFTFRYDVTVPAGKTVILMHFSAQRGQSNAAAAAAQAQALVNLSDPAALEGMSAEERAQVVNFSIQPGVNNAVQSNNRKTTQGGNVRAVLAARAASIALLQRPANNDPQAMSRENIERAQRIKRPLRQN